MIPKGTVLATWQACRGGCRRHILGWGTGSKECIKWRILSWDDSFHVFTWKMGMLITFIKKHREPVQVFLAILRKPYLQNLKECLTWSTHTDIAEQTPATDKHVWWRPGAEHFEADWEYLAFNSTVISNPRNYWSSMNTGSRAWTIDTDQGHSKVRIGQKETDKNYF